MAINYSETSATWGTWTDTATTNSSSTTVWYIWADGGTSGSVTYNLTWSTWTNVDSGDCVAVSSGPATEEQRRKWAEEQAERERKKKEAEERADSLLKSLLNPDQIKELDEMSAFIVTSEKGNVYRIQRGWAGNVEKLNQEGQATDRFCIHPKQYVPYADNMVVQKLMLETNEDEFLRVANRTRLTARPQPMAA